MLQLYTFQSVTNLYEKQWKILCWDFILFKGDQLV